MGKANKKRNVIIVDGDIAYIKIKQLNGKEHVATIDSKYVDKIKDYSWHVVFFKSNNKFYVKTTIYDGWDGEKFKSHGRLLHSMILDIDDGTTIDHIDNDTLNNKEENLRITTRGINTKNRTDKNSNNKSGYRNVCWDRKREKWIVQLQINKKNKVVGEYDDVHEAGKCAKEMREFYYGEFAGKG